MVAPASVCAHLHAEAAQESFCKEESDAAPLLQLHSGEMLHANGTGQDSKWCLTLNCHQLKGWCKFGGKCCEPMLLKRCIAPPEPSKEVKQYREFFNQNVLLVSAGVGPGQQTYDVSGSVKGKDMPQALYHSGWMDYDTENKQPAFWKARKKMRDDRGFIFSKSVLDYKPRCYYPMDGGTLNRYPMGTAEADMDNQPPPAGHVDLCGYSAVYNLKGKLRGQLDYSGPCVDNKKDGLTTENFWDYFGSDPPAGMPHWALLDDIDADHPGTQWLPGIATCHWTDNDDNVAAVKSFWESLHSAGKKNYYEHASNWNGPGSYTEANDMNVPLKAPAPEVQFFWAHPGPSRPADPHEDIFACCLVLEDDLCSNPDRQVYELAEQYIGPSMEALGFLSWAEVEKYIHHVEAGGWPANQVIHDINKKAFCKMDCSRWADVCAEAKK